ncbi:MAG: hypothetical protein AB1486_03900 [Planctomycetota bacterium]
MKKWSLFVGVLVVALVCGLALAQESISKPQSLGDTSSQYVKYMGVSTTGNVQQALAAAIKQAQDELAKKGADMMVAWEFDSMKGRAGGIAGLNEVTVTIRCPK